MKTRKSTSPLSVAAAENNQHLSKDGKYYDTYQLMVQANIRFNQERLKEKGLDQSSFAAFKPTPSKTTKPKASPRGRRRQTSATVVVVVVATEPVRRSNRKRNAPPENNGLMDDNDEFRQNQNGIRIAKQKRRRKFAAINQKNHTQGVLLTAEQRSKLQPNNNNNNNTNDNDDCWLPEFETYLLRHEGVSLPNCRSVMRQVEKLVSGAGITYSHWGENVFFQKDCNIKLSDDFGALFQQAVDFEEEHGRDLGNGWLMRHPIRKLENFQRYCLEKNASNAN